MAFLKVLGSANRQISHWKVNTYAYENLAFIPVAKLPKKPVWRKCVFDNMALYFQCRIKKKRIKQWG